ncbi:MAG TPA: M28 family peptidase [Solirubrobacteraceae bacterium]|nr:M28 family peptidase [Solirubrobacteraceae bacterium]
MLDPRIYRTGLMVVVVTVIVVAFSLGNQASPLSTTLVPDAFDGDAAYATMQSLASQYPDRPPGSEADGKIADFVAGTLSHAGFLVQRSEFQAQTVDGTRTLENVVGTLAGTSPGTIVVVAHRDAVHPGSAAELSGTGVMLELARVLSQQTQQRSIVLASTSGHVGAAGAAELARSLPGPVDAVIVLGDLAGLEFRSTSVVPWSDSQLVAPALLRNTVAAAVSQQAGVKAMDESLGGQFLHLAFPLAGTEQSPFVAGGQPAVLVSASGARAPAPDSPTSPARINGFGRAMLESVSALEAGPTVPQPDSYLRWSGKLVPAWAVRLLVLALILPVLAATIDGLARARRRGHRVGHWVLWVLSGCLPFVLAVLAIVGLRAVGAIDGAPPGPVGGDALTLSGGAVAILAGLVCLIAGGLVIRWRVGRHLWTAANPPVEPPDNGHARTRSRRAAVADDPASPGAAAALLLVLCAVTLVLWLANPFAAALLVPALHLWMWIVAPERRPAAPLAVLLFAAGLVPGVLAAVYYASALGLGAAPAAWNAVLMLAGGSVSVISAIEWSVVVGCVISLATMILWIGRQPRHDPSDLPITVRGPITYAGVGGTKSIGGTRSGLRR